MVTSPIFAHRRASQQLMRGIDLPKWLHNAQLALGWGIILLMVGLASGVYLSQVSQTALVGRNAELLSIELRDLRFENAKLRQQIAEAQSLARMQAQTQTLGLGYVNADPAEVEFLTVIVPAPQPTPEPLRDRIQPAPPTIEIVLWDAIRANISALVTGAFRGE